MRSRVLRLLVGAATCLGTAAGVLLATYLVGRIARWDVAAFLGLRDVGGLSQVSGVAWGVVDLADPLPTVALLAMICVAGLAWGRPRHVGAAVLLVSGAAITSSALKIALAHPRYQALLGPERLAADSFPSGHATTAMSVALAGVLVAPPRWRLLAAIAAACYALAAGLSVVIVGVHYPSDVLGAFLVSGCFGLLSVAALRATDGKPQARPRVAWPFATPAGGTNSPLAAVAAGAVLLGLTLALMHAGKLLHYAAADTSAVVAALGIALCSAALVYLMAAEANTS